MQTNNNNTVNSNTANTANTVNGAQQPMPNALGQFALYAQQQAQKAQQQAQRVANAVYVLVKPSKATLHRTATGNNTQAQTNANYASAILLQVYPLIAQSGLTQAQQTQVQQHMLQSIYTLQNAANTPVAKQAVQQVLGK